jgi:surface antigen
MKRSIGLALGVLLCVQAAALQAFNTLFADRMPIGRMDAEDVDILLAAVDRVLEHAADGVTEPWSNPKTGAGGYLTPRASYRDAGFACRDLEVENHAGGMHNRLIVSVCKQADGTWKVRP